MNQGLLNNRSTARSKAIPITSLVDVVFILLLFFMLTSSFLDWNSIQLKSATGGSSDASSIDQTQLLVLDKRGRMSLYSDQAQEDLSLAELLPSLKQDSPIVVFPQREVSVQSIVTTFDRLTSAGFKQVSLGHVMDTGESK